MKRTDFPSKIELENAIIEALKKLGGTSDVPTINQTLIKMLNLSDEVIELEDENGVGTKLDYRLRWRRTNLKAKGIIENVKRGI